jgi:hypothetical protein
MHEAWHSEFLRPVLCAGAGAKLGHQTCELRDQQGRPCGSVQYALCALRPIRAHPHANQLRRAGQGAAASAAPAEAARTQQQHGVKQQQQQQPPLQEDLPASGAPQQALQGGLAGSRCGISGPLVSLQGFNPSWAAGGPGLGGGGASPSFEEATYIRYTRSESPPAGPAAPAALWPGGSSARGAQYAAHCFPAATHPGQALDAASTLTQQGAQLGSDGGGSRGHKDSLGQAGIVSGPPATPASKRRLAIKVVGCRNLRVADSASARPYVSVCLRVLPGQHAAGRAAPGGGESCAGPHRLHGQGWLLETQPGRGPSPSFQEAAIALVEVPGRRPERCWESEAGEEGAAPVGIEAVVFDAGVDAELDAGGGVIGAARVPLPDAAARQRGAAGTECYPLVHPATGRHAGVLELQLAWDD